MSWAHNQLGGHVFLPEDKLVKATATLLTVPEETAVEGVTRLHEAGRIVRDTLLERQMIYLPELYEAETYVAKRLLAMAKAPGT